MWRRAPGGPWELAAYAEVDAPPAVEANVSPSALTPRPTSIPETLREATAKVRAADSSFWNACGPATAAAADSLGALRSRYSPSSPVMPDIALPTLLPEVVPSLKVKLKELRIVPAAPFATTTGLF